MQVYKFFNPPAIDRKNATPGNRKSALIPIIFSLLLCCVLFSGCAAGNHASAWREYKLFCGMSSKNGEFSEEAWKHFCDKHVSAAFPAGFTVLDAKGYWRSGPNAAAQERSKVILVIAPAGAREKVLAVAKRYREEFHQEAVLISSSDVETDLVQANDTDGR